MSRKRKELTEPSEVCYIDKKPKIDVNKNLFFIDTKGDNYNYNREIVLNHSQSISAQIIISYVKPFYDKILTDKMVNIHLIKTKPKNHKLLNSIQLIQNTPFIGSCSNPNCKTILNITFGCYKKHRILQLKGNKNQCKDLVTFCSLKCASKNNINMSELNIKSSISFPKACETIYKSLTESTFKSIMHRQMFYESIYVLYLYSLIQKIHQTIDIDIFWNNIEQHIGNLNLPPELKFIMNMPSN